MQKINTVIPISTLVEFVHKSGLGLHRLLLRQGQWHCSFPSTAAEPASFPQVRQTQRLQKPGEGDSGRARNSLMFRIAFSKRKIDGYMRREHFPCTLVNESQGFVLKPLPTSLLVRNGSFNGNVLFIA